jgi:hypothetical protein
MLYSQSTEPKHSNLFHNAGNQTQDFTHIGEHSVPEPKFILSHKICVILLQREEKVNAHVYRNKISFCMLIFDLAELTLFFLMAHY